jgi:hypothetical protein
MQSFSNALNILLEEEHGSSEAMQQALHVYRKIEATKHSINDLYHRLGSLKNKINAELAVNIKKTMPALNVGLDKNGNCKIGYKTKHLILNPDIEGRSWSVTSSDPRFSNKFIKLHRRTLMVNINLDSLISAITNYFGDYYKSLSESIHGDGTIMIEGKISTFTDLVDWRDGGVDEIALNSRLSLKNGQQAE